MNLLDTQTLKLEEVRPSHTHRYAILSHTWGEEEVSFSDLTSGRYHHRKGCQKIEQACRVARAEGYGKIWIDTCCIDESSSTKLSEAINSMFTWYAAADICFAYLGDVGDSDVLKHGTSELVAFEKSRWFQRGWTLQELVAPTTVVFLQSDWTEIGTKFSLLRQTSSVTRIPESVLSPPAGLHTVESARQCSVAQRMSWAADRQTEKIEDLAYCLMGLFEVNMPLLYGEGQKAFLRLQQHIMDQSNDASLFAWEYADANKIWRPRDVYKYDDDPWEPTDEREKTTVYNSGVLAESPAAFRRFRDAQHQPFDSLGIPEHQTNTTFEMTKRGVRIPTALHWLRSLRVGKLLEAGLFCGSPALENWLSLVNRPGVELWDTSHETLVKEQQTRTLDPTSSLSDCLKRPAQAKIPHDTAIALLPCGTPLGRIGVFVRHQDGVLERIHTDEISVVFLERTSDYAASGCVPTYFKASQMVEIISFENDADGGSSMCQKPKDVHLRVPRDVTLHGLEIYKTMHPTDMLESHCWKWNRLIPARAAARNRDEWPPILVCWRYDVHQDETFVHCETTAWSCWSEDTLAWDRLSERGSRSLSEVRVQLSDTAEVVIKIRDRPTYCELRVLIQARTALAVAAPTPTISPALKRSGPWEGSAGASTPLKRPRLSDPEATDPSARDAKPLHPTRGGRSSPSSPIALPEAAALDFALPDIGG